MTAVRLVGDVAEIRRAAARLQRAGETQAIADGIMAALRQEVQPLRQSAQQRALATLPHHGGLGAEVSRQPMPVSYSLSKRVGVRIRIDVRPGRGKAGVGDPGAINRGQLRHPVFGDRKHRAKTGTLINRDVWVTQPVPAGWFSIPMAQGAPRIRDALIVALRRELAKLQ